jgi:predicted permease
MLLIGAGLFLRTLENLRNVDVGFNPVNLAIFRVNPILTGYDEKRIPQLYAQILERLSTVPGVRAVALSNPIMLSGSVNSTSIFVQGRVYAQDQHDGINRVVISPNYFEAMEIPLLTGRRFTDRDTESAPKVVVINDAAAKKYFPNENPIGRRFGPNPEASGQMEVVGVIRDTKYDSIREPAPPTMYVPYVQGRVRAASFAVRTANDPVAQMGSIREAMRQIDPNLPLTNVTTQIEQIELRFAQEKVFAQACSLFGGLAVLLASIGLFGLMSYSVARRTNEIGIRMALGARGADVLRLVMRESMILVVAGVAIGLVAAFAAGRLVATLLFGLSPTDALTIAAATLLMLIVSAIAGYLPARRASRVDPMVALRCE